MLTEINKWKENGSDYQEGVRLFDQFGTDTFLKRLLKRSENASYKQMLTKALLELIADDPDPLEIIPQEMEMPGESDRDNSGPVPTPGETFFPAGQSPELLKVISRINATYAEIRGLHPYLSLLPEGEELADLALNIKKLGRRNAELWQRREYINEHGSDIIAISPAPPVMIDYNLLNEREQVRKSLNKAENRLKKQDSVKPNTIALITERKQQLQALDQKIAAIKLNGGVNG